VQYQIGPWLFIPSRCVISHNHLEQELEPLVFKLLNYFVANVDRIISRDELVTQVWQQKFVDDNAINRAISELRKQLSHPEHKAPLIKTHYRKGYSLTVSVIKIPTENGQESSGDFQQKEALPIKQSSMHLLKDKNDNQYKWLLIGVLGLLIANFVYSYININQTKALLSGQEKVIQSVLANDVGKRNSSEEEFVKTQVTAATWNMGSEDMVIVSPSNKYFAYANNYQGINTSFVRRKSDQKEVQLSYKDLNVLVLSWQPHSTKVLAEITNYKEECFYGLFDISDFSNIPPVKVIKHCQKEAYGLAQLSLDGNSLFYIILDQESLGGEIRVFNLETKKDSLLVLSGNAQYGVTAFKLSPEGNSLIYSWAKRGEPTQLYLYNLINRESRLLYTYENPSFYIPFAWLPDNNSFAVASGYKLKVIDIDSGTIKTIKLAINQRLRNISFEKEQQLLAQQRGGTNYQVVKLSNVFTGVQSYKKLYPTDSLQNFPVADRIHSATSYFVSYMSGIGQIWQEQQGKLKQVTHYPKDNVGGGFSELIQSPNGKFLLYFRAEKLEFSNIETGQVHQLPQIDAKEVTSYQWGKDENSFYYSMVDKGVSQIWQFDLLTRASKQITQFGGQKLLKNELEELFYINDNFLLSLAGEYKKKINIPIPQCWCSLSLTSKFLYTTDMRVKLSRMDVETGEVSYAPMPFSHKGIKMVDDNNALTVIVESKPTDIQRISWH